MILYLSMSGIMFLQNQVSTVPSSELKSYFKVLTEMLVSCWLCVSEEKPVSFPPPSDHGGLSADQEDQLHHLWREVPASSICLW